VRQFVRQSAAVGARLADWSTSLVMKGSPVRTGRPLLERNSIAGL
jgi:hypothetical protein